MRILVSGSIRMVRALAADWPDHLGILLTPANGNSVANVVKTGLSWGIDNGAYSGFDPAAFRRLVKRAVGQPRLLWVVCPDVVANARKTLQLYSEWWYELASAGLPVAFVMQDGQEDYELPEADCYFLGGSTRFKLSVAAADLMQEGQRRGALTHVGRVNSMRRLRMAWERGADSVDGSSYSRFHHRTLTHRPDMSLERHLRFLRSLEYEPNLWRATHVG